jgi:prephenate dehydrogenase
MTNKNLQDSQISIVGLGLMGGSIGLALKEKQLCRRVVGLVRRPEAAIQAVEMGAVDHATLDPAEALKTADLVLFSTPIRTILWQLKEYSPYYKPGAIITDMGSTKKEILAVMAELPPHLQPVGSHPMCGKEVAGMSAAEASLYRGAPWVITPLPRTNPETVEIVQEMAGAIGATPLLLQPDQHDKLVATISHLPYILSASLVLAAQAVADDDPTVWDVAAGGFRDTSRVAASDETMMLDILLTNRQPVSQLLEIARQQIDLFAQAVADGDADKLRQIMSRAAQQRRALYQ